MVAVKFPSEKEVNIITNYNSSLDHGGMGCQKEQKKKVGGGVSVRVWVQVQWGKGGGGCWQTNERGCLTVSYEIF